MGLHGEPAPPPAPPRPESKHLLKPGIVDHLDSLTLDHAHGPVVRPVEDDSGCVDHGTTSTNGAIECEESVCPRLSPEAAYERMVIQFPENLPLAGIRGMDNVWSLPQVHLPGERWRIKADPMRLQSSHRPLTW
jgi:hypothetical protein